MTTPVRALPSLENGDHLDREEFHRRYELRPDIRRAELVEGVVHVPSPMRYRPHDDPARLCVGLLSRFRALHPEFSAGANATLIIDEHNEVQPDGFLFRPGTLSENDALYLEGAPELVIEVSASTVSYDLHEKKEAYRRNGVREYLVWRVLDGEIDFFRLERSEYVRVAPDAEGIYESIEFPGLRFDTRAMIAIDDGAAQAALR